MLKWMLTLANGCWGKSKSLCSFALAAIAVFVLDAASCLAQTTSITLPSTVQDNMNIDGTIQGFGEYFGTNWVLLAGLIVVISVGTYILRRMTMKSGPKA